MIRSRRPLGIGCWYTPLTKTHLTEIQPGWFYTWESTNQWMHGAPDSAEFIPMIWGADNANSTELAAAQAVSDTLLGFNEPDNTLAAGGTEITPAQALALWPLLEATGMRLGAPAVASDAHTPNGWLDQFMQGNPSVDFIPLHWYGDLSLATLGDADVAVSALKSYIEAVWSRYGKPIWVTEFAYIGWDFDNGHIAPSATVQAQFLAAADQMMQTLPYVERWAWLPLTDYVPGVEPASMFNSSGNITAVGTAFKALRGWEPKMMLHGAEPITKVLKGSTPIWEAPTPQAGVQFVGSTATWETSTAVPTHEEGDLLIAFASGDSIPSLPAGWTSLTTNGEYPSRVAYRLAPSSGTASGTWTGATGLTILVYRGATAGAAAIHYPTASGPQTLPALNLSGTPSWVAGIGHWLTSLDSSPSGLTQRHAYEWGGLWVAAWDTGGDVTSWSATQVGPTAAAWSWLAASIQLIPN